MANYAKWSVKKGQSENCFLIDIDLSNKAEFWGLFRSDAHHDNAHCNHELEKKHLEQAKNRNAAIIDGGDLSCAMQGKWDRRKDQEALRSELRGNNYLDKLVKYNADFYKPYSSNFVYMGKGNHETAITNHHETDIHRRICERTGVLPGGYANFSIFRFKMDKTGHVAKTLFQHHGWGGGGPVTKGMIHSNRIRVMANADIHMIGHTHNQNADRSQQLTVTQNGRIYHRDQIYIRPSTYKDEYGSGTGGWSTEKGHEPKTLGAWWIRFTREKPRGDERYRVGMQIVEAS